MDMKLDYSDIHFKNDGRLKLLIIVGDDQTAYQMIDNYRQSRRYTALRVRLRRLCGVE